MLENVNNLSSIFPFFRESTPIPNAFYFIQAELEKIKNYSYKILHPLEQTHFYNIKHSKTQHSYLLGRYSSKMAISKCCNLDSIEGIQVTSGIWGQPIVKVPNYSNINVSLAHSEACAVALAFPEGYPMGIDIENPALIDFNLADLIITSQEFVHLKKTCPNIKEHIILATIWTLKEALSKALRCGLTVPLSVLETCNFAKSNIIIKCEYTNFSQYCGISWIIGDYVIGVAYPRQLSLEIYKLESILISLNVKDDNRLLSSCRAVP